MKSTSFTELFSSYENLYLNSSFKYIKHINELIKNTSDESLKLYLIQERLIHSIKSSYKSNTRYPSLRIDSKKQFDISKLTEYIKARINQSKNPFLKSKYADLLYEFNKSNKIYAQLAITNFLEASCIALDNGFNVLLIDYINWSLKLSIRINDDVLIKKCLKFHYEILEKIKKSDLHFVLTETIESLISNEKKISPKYLNYTCFENIINSKINTTSINENDESNRRRYIELKLKLKPIRRNNSLKKELRTQIANSFEIQGDIVGTQRSKMVAAIFYEKALKQYLDAGAAKKYVNNIKRKILDANDDAVNNEYKKVQHGLTINKKILDKYLHNIQLLKPEELLSWISQDPNLIPDYLSISERVKNEHKNNLIPFTNTITRNNLIVKTSSTYEEKIDDIVKMQMSIHSDFILHIILEKIFTFLSSNPGSSKLVESLLSKMGASNYLDDERKHIISTGLNYYIKNEHLASIHILAFQIEGVLKDVLKSKNSESFKYRNNVMRPLSLNSVLDEIQEKNILSTNLVKFIQINLCDIPIGKNLRNNIAHGDLNLKLFNKRTNQLLIFILLRITN